MAISEQVNRQLADAGVKVIALTVEQVAGATGLSVPWLNQLRSKGGDGPAYIKVGRRVLYRPEAVSAWLDSHSQTPKAA